jgi:hypothetical protein
MSDQMQIMLVAPGLWVQLAGYQHRHLTTIEERK